MYNATAYNHAYADSGLFCIHASATPTHVRDMVDVLTREIVAMAGPTGDKELRVILTCTFILLTFLNYCVCLLKITKFKLWIV